MAFTKARLLKHDFPVHGFWALKFRIWSLTLGEYRSVCGILRILWPILASVFRLWKMTILYTTKFLYATNPYPHYVRAEIFKPSYQEVGVVSSFQVLAWESSPAQWNMNRGERRGRTIGNNKFITCNSPIQLPIQLPQALS